MDDAQNSGKQRGKPFTTKDPRINRGGRPKGYNAFRKRFRDREKNDQLRDEVFSMAMDPSAKAGDRLNAIRLWFEYGWGKAPAAPEDRDAMRDGTAALSEHMAKLMTRDEMRAIAKLPKGDEE